MLKKITVIIAALLSSMSTYAEEAATAVLAESVQAYISGYAGTEPVMLPELPKEKYAKLDAARSYPPGIMPYTRDIVVDKPNKRLRVVTPHKQVLCTYPICASANYGQKRKADDSCTPEGTFKIIGVYNSTDWTYKDTGVKAYGPYFIHLYTPPFYGIGIHGTNAPYSVPGRSSHGCMRMHNETIVKMRNIVNKDTRVTILPDPFTSRDSNI